MPRYRSPRESREGAGTKLCCCSKLFLLLSEVCFNTLAVVVFALFRTLAGALYMQACFNLEHRLQIGRSPVQRI